MSIYLLLPLVALASNLGLAVMTLRGDWQAKGHRLFALFLLSMALWGGLLYMMRSSATLEEAFFWDKLVIIDVALISVFYLHFTYGFTRLASAVWVMPVTYLVLGVVAASTLLDATVTGMQMKPYGYAPVLGPAFAPFIVFSYGAIIVGAVNVWHATRHGESPAIRNRAGYILVGTVASLIGGTTDFLPVLGVPVYPLGIVGNVLFALLATVAMVKVRLLDIRLALRRGLAYTVLASVVIGLFLTGDAVFARLFDLGPAQSTLAFTTLFLLAVVAAVPNIHGLVNLWVDRSFFRNRYSALKALERFSHEMKDISNAQSFSASLVNLVKGATSADFVALLQPDEQRTMFVTVASEGMDETFELPYSEENSALSRLGRLDRVASAQEVSLFPEWQAISETERAKLESTRARLFVPVKSKGQLAGVLVLGPRAHGAYT
ncbi:MAG: histidine kinase N-terminal 7TM domain-containing protein, partial [Dehalococcoidia bacterium]